MNKSILFFFISLTIFAFANSAFQYKSFKHAKAIIDNDEVKFITEDKSVSFFAIGDWGGLSVFPYRTIIEDRVSLEMTNLAKKFNTRFQLALGDNFYFDGVVNSDDKRFNQTYESVFNSEPLEDSPWFLLLGNHDHYGNASAQVDYTNKSKRWILPSYNYTIDVKVNNDDQDDLITIMMIDTVIMCGNSPFSGYGQPVFQSTHEEKIANDYFADFEQRLSKIAQTKVPYILVAGHFPVWSIAEHGPTACLVDKLRPLLHKYNVTAYLCGHDHNLQHIQDTYLSQTVDYIVTGASNFVEASEKNLPNIPPNSLKFYWSEKSSVTNGGFNLIIANENNMTVTFFETDGKELYQTVLYPRKF